MDNNKTLKIVGGILAAIIGYNMFFGTTPNAASSSTVDPTGNGSVTNPGGTFDAKKIADAIWEEVKTFGNASVISGNGDEKDNIFSLLIKVNDSQFTQVVKAFGNKPYNPTWSDNYFGLFSDPEYHTLPFILKNELASADYKLLQNKYPSSL